MSGGLKRDTDHRFKINAGQSNQRQASIKSPLDTPRYDGWKMLHELRFSPG